MMTDCKREFYRWLDSPALSETEWRELDALRDNDTELKSRFRAPLEFGTGGMRGLMGTGLARMNVHVIRWATQAFARLVVDAGDEARRRGVVICHDCRIHSREFAEEAACVCAANGIHVRLFEDMRPTPELSFAVLHYGATAGINITASHNPKEYNGYKVYWSDGAQLPPRHAEAIAAGMAATDIFSGVATMPYSVAREKGLIEFIGAETDEAFLNCVLSQAVDRASVQAEKDRLKIAYTPFHGAGRLLVPEALRRLGLTQIFPVAEQMVPDGSFPTVKSPNPENPEGFAMALEVAAEHNCNLILGTDPDSDRVGVMVPDHDGVFRPLSGNQIGALLADYLIRSRRETGTLPENAAILTTIVSTGLIRAICEANDIHFEETFTGFKFMAEKLAEYGRTGDYRYILAFEESYGYMTGDFVRDKDAVTASLLVAEMAAYYLHRGRSLWDAVRELYVKYGYFSEITVNLYMEGPEGPDRMAALMTRLRETPPQEIGGYRVLRLRDYRDGTYIVPDLGPVGSTPIAGMDVLYFELEDGTNFIIRPSGTEPKVKAYVLARGADEADCALHAARCADYARALANG